jgi:hypothetical protein
VGQQGASSSFLARHSAIEQSSFNLEHDVKDEHHLL